MEIPYLFGSNLKNDEDFIITMNVISVIVDNKLAFIIYSFNILIKHN